MIVRQPLEIYLNHSRLRDLSPKILINGITENQPTYDTTTGERPGFWGERILADDRTELTISVEIILRELYDRTLRGQLVEQIGSWMRAGGELTVSYRPDRKLQVIPRSWPVLGAVRDINQSIDIQFAAKAIPFWESMNPQRYNLDISAAGGSAYVDMQPSGSAPYDLVECTITNSGTAALNTITVQAGSTWMSFTGLAIPKNKTFVIRYDETGLLRLTGNGAEKVSCRTAASSDDLLVIPGTAGTRLRVSGTDQPVHAVFSVRGLWA